MSPRPQTPPANLVTADTAAPAAAAAAGGEASAFNGADPRAFDHDGDGKPGGSLPIGAVVKAGKVSPELPGNLAPHAPVLVRITKKGHGVVHDGQGGTYRWQDEVGLPYAVALAQEGNGYVEIIGQ